MPSVSAFAAVRSRPGRVGLPALVALLTALVVALPVAAAPPDRNVLAPQTFLIAGACDFDVLYEDLKVRYTAKFWSRGGSLVVISTGQHRVRLTNQETGRWLIVNYNGPFRFRDGRFSGTGHWVQWDLDSEGLWLTTGRLTTLTDLSSLRGRRVDLCAKLSEE